MITALVSSVLGLAGGLLPDLFKELRAGREHRREIERMDKQVDLQIRMMQVRSDLRMAEIEQESVVAELKAAAAQMTEIYQQQRPVGIVWIDGLNALIRPVTALLLMLLFVATAVAYTWSLIGAIDLTVPDDWGRLAVSIWGSLVGEAIQAVLGYLFGYRTTAVALRIRR
ncbi:MAG: hypothetical protein AB7O45_02370 [Alphaproteobacteria bacterium]